MTALLDFISSPDVRGPYLVVCLILMVAPMIGLSIWYHSRIGKTQGGRDLMERQRQSPPMPRGSFLHAQDNIRAASDMHEGIQSGRYGEEAKRMQRVVYWVVGLWITAVIVAFGLLIWADAVKGAPPA